MKKYLYLVKTHVSLITTYRVDLIWAWIYRFFSFYVMYSLWSLTTDDKTELAKIMQYFALYAFVLESLGTNKVARWFTKDALRGDLKANLIRPINYPLTLLIKVISVLLARIAVPCVILILGMLVYPDIFAPDSIFNLIFFIIFALLATLLWNCILLCISTLSLWGTEVGHFLTVIDLSIGFLKGQAIPAYLFPLGLIKVLSFTPIPYLASYAIQVYQNELTTEFILKGLIINLLWILFFLLLFNFIYKKGLVAYEASGS